MNIKYAINETLTNRNLDRCLFNEPSMTVGDPVCGNGIRERDEICDCGSPEVRSVYVCCFCFVDLICSTLGNVVAIMGEHVPPKTVLLKSYPQKFAP